MSPGIKGSLLGHDGNVSGLVRQGVLQRWREGPPLLRLCCGQRALARPRGEQPRRMRLSVVETGFLLDLHRDRQSAVDRWHFGPVTVVAVEQVKAVLGHRSLVVSTFLSVYVIVLSRHDKYIIHYIVRLLRLIALILSIAISLAEKYAWIIDLIIASVSLIAWLLAVALLATTICLFIYDAA